MLGIVANPSYAGSYVFGRYKPSKQVATSGEIVARSRHVPQDAWRVMIREHHDGYIDWDQFVANSHRLAANRTNDGRYEAVDPANCLIAATLEQRWNDALQRLHDLEAELARFEQHTMRAVTAEQKRQILQLAGDFPRMWAASTTTDWDRKRILRLLIRDVTVSKGPVPKIVRLHVRWQSGATETLELRLPPNRAEAIRYPDAFVGRIRDLAARHHDDDIVRLLAAEGHQSSTGKPLTPSMIQCLRYKPRAPGGVALVADRQIGSFGHLTRS